MLSRSAKPPAREILSLLDVGTFKTTCLIAARPGWRILGIGQARSEGIKAGSVADLNRAEETVRAAVGRAEAQAGLRVEEVVVAATCGRIGSAIFRASAGVAGDRVCEADIDRVLAGAEEFVAADGRSLLHLHDLGYRIDGETAVANPLGMGARRLSLDVNAVTADEAPIRNLRLLIERCYLRVAEVFAAPYASALAAMTEEEARLGVTVVDMGGGTTTFASFIDGHFVHADAVAVGGNHLTYDIARTLSTPLADAERIKTLYANLLGAHADEHELVSYPLAGEEQGGLYHTSRFRLRQIVRPRIEEILRLVRDRLQRSAYADAVSGRRAGRPADAGDARARKLRPARHDQGLPRDASGTGVAVAGRGPGLDEPGPIAWRDGTVRPQWSGARARLYGARGPMVS
jgi:cell division protein FtsA